MRIQQIRAGWNCYNENPDVIDTYLTMLIVADENMPYAREWFSAFGEVRTLPGRAMTAAALRDADALLVRSVTKVNRQLLGGTRVKFVGTATSGTEHLDADYLRAQQIEYAAATGCNATSVVEYVLSCLCAFDGVLEKLFAGGTVGIVGLGNVGARLLLRLQALGIRGVGYDPLISVDVKLPVVDLDTVLNADVICCHTPLTQTGPYPTRHLLDAKKLSRLRQGAVLINAGRGGVVANEALLQVLQRRNDLRVALDVWEGEPVINYELLETVTIATPHIAGYSWDGKVAGTRMVLQSFCEFFQLPLPLQVSSLAAPTLHISENLGGVDLIKATVQAVYDVRNDDKNMRDALLREPERSAENFDWLRKYYPVRRELAACTIANAATLSADNKYWLQRLGFAIP